jgi:hypothetical protein
MRHSSLIRSSRIITHQSPISASLCLLLNQLQPAGPCWTSCPHVLAGPGRSWQTGSCMTHGYGTRRPEGSRWRGDRMLSRLMHNRGPGTLGKPGRALRVHLQHLTSFVSSRSESFRVVPTDTRRLNVGITPRRSQVISSSPIGDPRVRYAATNTALYTIHDSTQHDPASRLDALEHSRESASPTLTVLSRSRYEHFRANDYSS